MKSRWMRRKNENGEEEKFYPITHAKAVVSSDGTTTLEERVNNITCESIGAATEEQLSNTFANVDVLETAMTLPRGIYYFKATCTNRPTSNSSGYHVIVSTR